MGRALFYTVGTGLCDLTQIGKFVLELGRESLRDEGHQPGLALGRYHGAHGRGQRREEPTSPTTDRVCNAADWACDGCARAGRNPGEAGAKP